MSHHATASGVEMVDLTSADTPPYARTYVETHRQRNAYVPLSDGDDDHDDHDDSSLDTRTKAEQTLSPRTSNHLRQFRLQLLSLIPGRWKTNIEHRKVGIYYDRRVALLQCLLHIIPLSGAITLLALQWTSYWIGTRTNVSTMLQFVAKTHELAMQASLVEVLLCIIRTQLVNNYVPLGALSSATQATQLSGWRKLSLVCIIPILLVLTSLVGPSSAILMIPRPDVPNTIQEATLYSDLSMEDLYPSALNQLNLVLYPFEEYDTAIGCGNPSESEGLNKTSFSSITAGISCSPGGDQWIRVLHDTIEPRRQPYEALYTATIPTCLSSWGFDKVVGDQPYMGIGNRTTFTRALHPIVSTQCTYSGFNLEDGIAGKENNTDSNVYYLYDNGTARGTLFDFQTLAGLNRGYDNSTSTKSWTDSDSMFVERGTSYGLAFYPPTWLPSPEPGSNSLIGIFPTWTFKGNDMIDGWHSSGPSLSDPPDSETYRWRIHTCTISAFWNTADIKYIEKSGSRTVQTSRLGLLAFQDPRPITLDVRRFGHAINSPAFARGLRQSRLGDNALSVVFALSIASRSIFPDGSALWNEKKPLRGEHGSRAFKYTTILYGYGYGSRPTSVHLALAVISTYCAITIAYMVYILTTGLSSTAWNSAIEIVMLALQSRKPDHLGNIGVGLDSIETFKEGVGIRVNQDNELELVFAHDRELDKPGLRFIEKNSVY